jgi:N-acetylneuraminic acid mutarotase
MLLRFGIERKKKWYPIAPAPGETGSSGFARAGDKIYVIGGYGLSRMHIYNTVTDTWETGPDMPDAKGAFACAAVNGKIHCISGYTGSSYAYSHYIYDTATDTWITHAETSFALNGGGTAVDGGKIHILGGANGKTSLSIHYVFDTVADAWIYESAAPVSGQFGTVGIVGRKMYAIGPANATGRCDEYDLDTKIWTRKADLPVPRRYTSGGAVNGRIHVTGAEDAGNNIHNVYDPVADRWSIEEPPPLLAFLTFNISGNRIYLLSNNGSYVYR